MSKIEELIEVLCPDGVEWKNMWEVTAWDKKFNGIEKSMQRKVINYPYVLANEFKRLELKNGNVRLLSTGSYIGWTSEELAGKNLCEGEIVAIPWGGKANIKYYRGKFVTADNRIATSLNCNILLNKFLYYWMLENNELIEGFYRGSGIKHPNMKSVLTMQIPLPPLPIQQEIVSILDTFTSLQAELEAELEARKKQYEYYRNELLNFEGKEVEWKTLGEIAYYPKSRISSTLVDNTNYIGVENLLQNRQGKTLSNYVPTTGNLIEYKINDILIGNIRPYLKKIWKATNDGGTNGDVVVIRINSSYIKRLNSSYLYFLLSSDTFFDYDMQYAKGAKMPRGDKDTILKYKIPIPSIVEQERIVGILDKFDTLINDPIIGLPAEIEARRKQYEYYRNKLLSFQMKSHEQERVVQAMQVLQG